MTLRFCDGPLLTRAVVGALATLERHADEVDALNVFPVPDGDTGRNMVSTMRAAVARMDRLGPRERTLEHVGDAVAGGALLGARGNSGVILSQVLRGMAQGARGHERTDGRGLAAALQVGCRAAYACVPNPVEGTMLSVVRAAAQAATATASRDASVEAVLGAAVRASAEAVAQTPHQLPILREAGVVDAGGRGFELLLRGTLLELDAGPVAVPAPPLLAFPEGIHDGEDDWGYETMFLVTAPQDVPLQLDHIRAALGSMGTCVLVAGGPDAVRVHLHSDRPDLAIGYGLTLGRLSGIIVEDMDAQAALRAGPRVTGTTDADGGSWDVSGHVALVGARTPLAVVAVALGAGLTRTFEAAGARVIVPGGRGASPSVEQLRDAIVAAHADAVMVLPNDRNVRMAAEAACEGLDREAIVIPTRTPAEGLAAALAVDPRGDATRNAARMRDAASTVRSFVVAEAVRDATIDGRHVSSGDAIALDADDRLLAAGPDPETVALEAVARIVAGAELVTLFAGGTAEPGATERLAARVRDAHPGVTVEAHDGGQPGQAWLIAAE